MSDLTEKIAREHAYVIQRFETDYCECECGHYGEYTRHVAEVTEAAVRAEVTITPSPGLLRWKFDGGRGAVLNEDGVIVGYMPVQPSTTPSREDVVQMLRDFVDRPTSNDTVLRTTEDQLADAILALLPGRSEAEVKSEAWDEGYRASGIMLPTNPPRWPSNPYRADELERGESRG